MSYIKREDALKRINCFISINDPESTALLLRAEHAVADIPAADVRENVRGEWEKVTRHPNSWKTCTGINPYTEREQTVIVHEECEYEWLRCPYCKAAAADNYQNYCPNCGANMSGEQKIE